MDSDKNILTKEKIAKIIYIHTTLHGCEKGNESHIEKVFNIDNNNEYYCYSADARKAADLIFQEISTDNDLAFNYLSDIVAAVGNFKVPKTKEDAFLQINFTLGPVYTRAKEFIEGKPISFLETHKKKMKEAIALLEECASQFEFYENNHKKKYTEEGNKKAEINRLWVNRIKSFIKSL